MVGRELEPRDRVLAEQVEKPGEQPIVRRLGQACRQARGAVRLGKALEDTPELRGKMSAPLKRLDSVSVFRRRHSR